MPPGSAYVPFNKLFNRAVECFSYGLSENGECDRIGIVGSGAVIGYMMPSGVVAVVAYHRRRAPRWNCGQRPHRKRR